MHLRWTTYLHQGAYLCLEGYAASVGKAPNELYSLLADAVATNHVCVAGHVCATSASQDTEVAGLFL